MNYPIYQFQDFEFEHQIKTALRHTYIKVDQSGKIVLRSPKITEKEAFDTIQKQLKWIYSQLDKVKHSHNIIPYSDNDLYLGKLYPLNFVQMKEKKDITIAFKNFSLNVYSGTKKPAKRILNEAMFGFYNTKSFNKLSPVVDEWIKKMEVQPRSYVFKRQKKRWGSCTSEGRIFFNSQLIKLPYPLIELIIVHELAHLKFHNHSKEFWRVVENYLPNYKQRKEKLKCFSIQYQNFF